MELSYFLGQLIGLALTFFVLAVLIKPERIRGAVEDFEKNHFLTYVIGILTMVMGLAIMLSHNVWEMSWRVLITLTGWSAFIKGLLYIASPGTLVTMGRKTLRDTSRMYTFLAILLVVGVFLTYKALGN